MSVSVVGDARPSSDCLALESSSVSTKNELRRSIFAPLIKWLYAFLNCKHHWSVASLLIKVTARLEGGEMRSATAREIMQVHHGVTIGAYTYGECFDPRTGTPHGVTFGRYVSIAAGARIFTQNHPLNKLSTHPFFYWKSANNPTPVHVTSGSLEIGNDVWIGCNALITPGCHRIGNGAVIGAGAVVTRDVADYAIVAGNPAKRIRDRFSEKVIARLLAAQWWDLTIEEVESRKEELERLLEDE